MAILAVIMVAIFSFADFCGYVYTQLTDIQQEINGLLTTDRKPKFDVEWLKSVHIGQIVT